MRRGALRRAGRLTLRLLLALACARGAGSLAACGSGHPSLATELVDSRYTILAKVEKEAIYRSPDDPIGVAGRLYTVRVSEVFGGAPPKRLVLDSVNTTSRFNMDVGESYLLLVQGGYAKGWVSNCGNSGTLRETAEAVAALRAAQGQRFGLMSLALDGRFATPLAPAREVAQYRNEEMGFAVRVPAGMQIASAQDPLLDRGFAASRGDVQLWVHASYTDAASMAEVQAARQILWGSGCKLLSRRPTTLAGKPALQWVRHCAAPGDAETPAVVTEVAALVKPRRGASRLLAVVLRAPTQGAASAGMGAVFEQTLQGVELLALSSRKPLMNKNSP